jgi:glycosyltransferase involved in cell wall biosynthesis
MPKILYLVTEDWFFVSHFLPMARAAAAAGFEVVVATRVGEHAGTVKTAGFRLIAIDSERHSTGVLKVLRYVARTFTIIRNENPDIVHCIALRCVILGGVAARLGGARALILAPTGLGYLWLQQGLLICAVRAVVSTVVGSWLRGSRTRYLFENRDDPPEFGLSADDADVTIIGGAGVDPTALPMYPEPIAPPVKIAVVARMIRPKGIEEAVAAARRAQAKGAAIELHLFGAPDPANPTTFTDADLRRLSAEPGIFWHGRAADVAQVWRDHHIALLLSYREGLPRALVEAAACGRPIVTTIVAGCREVVRNAKEGFLVPCGDIDAAANALVALAASASQRQEMGLAANARFCKRFTEDIVMAEVGKLYRALCNSP